MLHIDECGDRAVLRRFATIFAVAALSAAALAASFSARAAGALGEQCSGESIAGYGSSLQSGAQSVWGGEKAFGFNVSSDGRACNGSQGSGGTPGAAYTEASSAVGLHDWGAEDGSTFNEEAQFIGTDEAPAGPVGETGTQLANMKKAVGSDMAVIPVAQTAVAIVASPPDLGAGHEACSLSQITLNDLEGVFRGTTTNWRQLGTVSDQESGGDCDQAVTRVVRDKGSGQTYQLKHFLHQINSSPLACTGAEKKTWSQLQPSKSEYQPNTVWPRKADCQKEKEGEGPVTLVTTPGETGGKAVAQYVKANPGTIGYAGLPEAQAHSPGQILDVYNGAGFAGPGVGENDANCAAVEYELPGGWETGTNVDWSAVYGSNPEIGGSTYPLCTLTWAVAATDSTAVFGEAPATTVHDYLNYVVGEEGGQPGLAGAWYRSMPSNVVAAAEAAITEIGGDPEVSTALCKVSPENSEGTLLCPSGQRYAGVVEGELPAEAKATFEATKGGSGTISCDKATLVGAFTEDGASISGEEGVTMSFGGGESGYCSSTIEALESEEVEVSFQNPPYDASKFVYLAAIAPQASFAFAKDKGAVPILGFVPKGAETECVYTPTFLSGQVVNGSSTALLMSASWQATEGLPEGCPDEMSQANGLSLTQGGGGSTVYIAGG